MFSDHSVGYTKDDHTLRRSEVKRREECFRQKPQPTAASVHVNDFFRNMGPRYSPLDFDAGVEHHQEAPSPAFHIKLALVVD